MIINKLISIKMLFSQLNDSNSTKFTKITQVQSKAGFSLCSIFPFFGLGSNKTENIGITLNLSEENRLS